MEKDYMDINAFINEAGRGRPRKTPSIDQMDGKDAEKNGSGGTVGVNEPVDKEVSKEIIEEIPKEQLNKNMKQLLKKFETQHDFFIVGKAGWGKTSIIKSLAERYHREVVTVYLDKVAAVDLGGIPVPERGKRDVAYQKKAMPKFAYDLWQAQCDEKDEKNPKRKFLLFFDEMNQARPDVMNALMPIVLEHEICEQKFYNFFVGAAGNFEEENDAVNELSGPLASRFAPLIIWRTDDESWRSAFEYMHKKWDPRIGKEMVSLFEDNCHLFINPREVEMKMLDFIWKLKESPRKSYFDVDDYLDQFEGLAKEERTKSEDETLGEIAEKVYEYVNKNDAGGEEAEEDKGRSSRKTNEMIDKNVLDAVRFGMKHGYVHVDDKNWGVSRENIWILFDEELANAEIIKRVINKFEAEGIKFKYEKDSEWQKAGYLDPKEAV
jgi:hypothetical protein